MCVWDKYSVMTLYSGQLNGKVIATEKFGQDLEAEGWPGSITWTLTVTVSQKSWCRQEKNRDSRVSVILFSIVNLLYNHIRRQRCHSLGALRLPSPSLKKSKDTGAPVLFVRTRDGMRLKVIKWLI